MKKQSLILSAAVAATLTSGVVLADLSTNAAATSNYLWRGVTQSGDSASVSGGKGPPQDDNNSADNMTGKQSAFGIIIVAALRSFGKLINKGAYANKALIKERRCLSCLILDHL